MSWIRRIITFVSILLFFPTISFAQLLQTQRAEEIEAGMRYAERPYLVLDYSSLKTSSPEAASFAELLEQPIEGFYFYLKQDSLTGRTLVRQQDGTFTPFAELLSLIRKDLMQKPQKIMTLFLDYVVDLDIAKEVTHAQLQDCLLEYNAKQGWASLAEMMQSNRRLVLFEVRSHMQTPSWLHKMDEFVLHTDPAWSNFNEQPDPFDVRLPKTLSLSSFLKETERFIDSPDDLNWLARRSPYLIETFKQAWIRDGMVPNFLLISKYSPWMDLTLQAVRSFQVAYGIVSCNGDLLSYVNWKGFANHTTGRFCFPIEPGTELQLRPTSPGYSIEPASRTINTLGLRSFVGEFKASPLPIQNELVVYFPFEKADETFRTKTGGAQNHGVEHSFDPQRGRVAYFDGSSSIQLPTANELLLRDHDFTVAAWLNIPKYKEGKEDYCILGSIRSAYQRSLHLMIRNKKPYMGFFNNDLVGNTVIEEGKWYHIAWRYNKQNHEQALFVNGRLDAIAEDRPPYLGSDSLMVGIGLTGGSSYFEGSMDNLSIWSRTLSNKEISGLSNQLIAITPTSSRTFYATLGLVVVAGCLLLIGLFYYRHKSNRGRTDSKGEKQPIQQTEVQTISQPSTDASPVSAHSAHLLEALQKPSGTTTLHKEKKQPANSIRLFGEFCVMDSEGEEITALFTPKLKQLFLLLLVHSSRGVNGISSNALTELIWGSEASSKNTKSLRSVSILKLRKILERMDRVEILFTSNRYLLQFTGSVTCDYLRCLAMLKQSIDDKESLERLLAILYQGEIFEQESHPWLDDTKSYICNSVVDVLTHHLPYYSVENESDQLIRLADQILQNDPCNEEALRYKIQALIHQNNCKSARYAFQRFTALYEELYGEPFAQTFESFTDSEA